VPDWRKIVREKLGSLPLKDRGQEEVIDELAQQLESAYEEAIANGASESESRSIQRLGKAAQRSIPLR
jgi:hypothetical protein